MRYTIAGLDIGVFLRISVYIGVQAFSASKTKFVRRWASGRAAVAAVAAVVVAPKTTVIHPTRRQPTTRHVARPAVAGPTRTILQTLRRRVG